MLMPPAAPLTSALRRGAIVQAGGAQTDLGLEEDAVLDLWFILLTVAFFAAAAGFAVLCGRLVDASTGPVVKPDDPEAAR
jgi:hypothetical protein